MSFRLDIDPCVHSVNRAEVYEFYSSGFYQNEQFLEDKSMDGSDDEKCSKETASKEFTKGLDLYSLPEQSKISPLFAEIQALKTMSEQKIPHSIKIKDRQIIMKQPPLQSDVKLENQQNQTLELQEDANSQPFEIAHHKPEWYDFVILTETNYKDI